MLLVDERADVRLIVEWISDTNVVELFEKRRLEVLVD